MIVLIFLFLSLCLFLKLYFYLREIQTLSRKIQKIPELTFLSGTGQLLLMFLRRLIGHPNQQPFQQEMMSKILGIHSIQSLSSIGVFKVCLGFYPPILVLTRPETAEGSLKSSGKDVLKPFLYKFSHSFLGRGLITANGRKWKERRRMLTPAFHFRILQDFLPRMGEMTSRLVKVLDVKIDSSEYGMIEDIADPITRCTLDIICQTAMGVDIRAQDGENIDYVSSLKVVLDLITQRTMQPWFFNDFVYNLTKDGKKYRAALQKINDFTDKVIQQKKEEFMRNVNNNSSGQWEKGEQSGRRAFLHSLLEEHFNNPLYFTDKDIREEVNTFMFAGHDTTAMSLTMTVFLLGCHQDIQENVQQELDRIFPNSSDELTLDSIRELKYLEAVIKESLRLFPSVSYLGRRMTEDIVLSNPRIFEQEEISHIPKGIDTYALPYVVHRCSDHWPQPEKFEPERFLNSEHIKNRHPYAFIPFAAGGRNCLGQKFAFLEEKAILASVFRHFTVESVEKRDQVGIIPNLTLIPDKQIGVKISRRNKLNF